MQNGLGYGAIMNKQFTPLQTYKGLKKIIKIVVDLLKFLLQNVFVYKKNNPRHIETLIICKTLLYWSNKRKSRN